MSIPRLPLRRTRHRRAGDHAGGRAAAEPPKIEELQAQAAKFNDVLTIPTFETSTEAVAKAAEAALAEADAALEALGKLPPKQLNFANTIGALDAIGYNVGTVANRLTLIRETSPDAAVREAAKEAVTRIEKWSIGLDYREDVYKAVQAYAKTKPKLPAEQARLLEYTLRDYRRAGLSLAPDKRRELEKRRKELADLTNTFQVNVTNAVAPVEFTRAELDGVPDDFLNAPRIQKSEDGQKFTIMANEAYQAQAVLDNARNEVTRRRVYVARDSLASDMNRQLLNEIITLRFDIARRLGYASWADYQTETKMVKSAAAAQKFLDELIKGIQPKFAAEVEEMRQLKAADTSDEKAKIYVWDWRYYSNQIKKQKYAVDADALRVFFPMEKTIAGMFQIYERIFGLKFTQLEPPYKWVDNLQLWLASDAQSGEPHGPLLPRPVSARGEVQSLRAVRHHRGPPVGGRQISAPRGRAGLQFSAARRGQAFAAQPPRCRDALPRVRPRHAFDPDAGDLWTLCGHERAA